MEDNNKLKEKLIKAEGKNEIKKILENEFRFKLYKEDFTSKSKLLKFTINNAIDTEVELAVYKVNNLERVTDDIYKILNEKKENSYKVFIGKEKEECSFIGTEQECYSFIKDNGYEQQSYVEAVRLSEEEYNKKINRYFQENNPFTENFINFTTESSKSSKKFEKFLSEVDNGLKILKNRNLVSEANFVINGKKGEVTFSLETNIFKTYNKNINDFKENVLMYFEENNVQVYPLLKSEEISMTNVKEDFVYNKTFNDNYKNGKTFFHSEIGYDDEQYLNTSYPSKIVSKLLTINNYLDTLKYDPEEQKMIFKNIDVIFDENKELGDLIKECVSNESWRDFKNDLFANAFKDEVIYKNLDFSKEDLKKNLSLPIFYESVYFNAIQNIEKNFQNRFEGLNNNEINLFLIKRADEFGLRIENGMIKEFESPDDVREFFKILKNEITLEFTNSIAGDFEQNSKGELYIKSGKLQELQKEFLNNETGTVELENEFLKRAYEIYVAVNEIDIVNSNPQKILEGFNENLEEYYGYHRVEFDTTNMKMNELNDRFDLRNEVVLINKFNKYMEINTIEKTTEEQEKNKKEKEIDL